MRRDGRHEWKGYNERRDDHRFGRNVSHGNRGHHNQPEIREDFQKIREARNEVRQDRGQLRKDYRELKRDKVELRKDIRKGASPAEIARDRSEIKEDWQKIAASRRELRQDQGTLDAARL